MGYDKRVRPNYGGKNNPASIPIWLAGTEIILKIYFVPQRYEVRVNIDTSQIYTEERRCRIYHAIGPSYMNMGAKS